MLQMNKIIYTVLLVMLLSCIGKDISQEDYDALADEGIKKAEYESMVNAINLCITDLKHGHQPIDNDPLTKEFLNASSRVYCSDYTTTLEHPVVRYCRYLIYNEKNPSNVQSCHCELIAKQKEIRAELKNNCNELKNAYESNNQAIVAHLGESFQEECASLIMPTAESGYACD